MDAPVTAAPAAPDDGPPGRGRRHARWLLAGGLGVVAVLLGIALSLPFHAWGSRLLLGLAPGLLPGLQVEAPQGALLGDFEARRLRYALDARQTVVLERPSWQGARLRRDGAGWQLSIDALHVERAGLQGASANDGRAPTLPRSLVLPIGVRVGRLAIGTLGAPPLQDRPVRDVRAALVLGRGSAATHRLTGVSLQWDRLRAGGDLSIQASAPLTVTARIALAAAPATATATPGTTLAGTPWQASVQVAGPLARLQLDGRLSARDQSLTARAVVEPVTPMPLRELDAALQGLDLAGLSSAWPRTAFSGTVQARLDDRSPSLPPPPGPPSAPSPALPGPAVQPVAVTLDLRNALAGRWDAGRVPVRSLQATAASDLRRPERGRIDRLVAQLGTAEAPAGVVEATGTWQRRPAPSRPWDLAVNAELRQLLPQALDRRAPALRLSGPVQARWSQAAGPADEDRVAVRATLQGEQLTAPAPSVQAAASAAAATPAAPAAAAPSAAVQVELDAEGTRSVAEIRRFRARAGAASLAGTGRVARAGTGANAVVDVRMDRFDPSLWWPALGGAAKLPYRLDGSVVADLRWPGPPRAQAATALDDVVARLQGTARLQLADSSVVAGVPVSGTVTLAGAGQVEGNGRFNVGRPASPGGRPEGELSITGAIDRAGAAQRWTLHWLQPRVEAVAPWLGLALPGWGVQGDIDATATLAGPAAQWQTSGQMRSRLLRWQAAASSGPAAAAPPPTLDLRSGEVRNAQGRWQAGLRPQDALQLQAGWDQARWHGLVTDHMSLQVSGTGADHRLQLTGAAWSDTAAGPSTTVSSGNGGRVVSARTGAPRRFETEVQAQGGWSRSHQGTTDRLAWQGRLLQWEVREPAPATAPGVRTAPAVTWLRAAPTALRLVRDTGTGGSTVQAHIEPTRLSVADAGIALEALQWQQHGRGATLDLRARLDPTPMAPWLAKLQPDFGWAGDLRVGGSVAVQATPEHFTAQAELARLDGDLVVRDPDNPAGPQALGLGALRMALSARDGVWRASEDVTGSALGTLQGTQTARTRAAAWWPGRDAALAGDLQLQIAQLGQWGHWLPLGWRLAGAVDGRIRLGGQWAEPRLDGVLVGRRIAVRNLLQGVDWHDADLRVALSGDTVRLEQFVVHAGPGTLNATGQARLDGAPRVTLQARAERFAALQRVDRRVVVSGAAEGVLEGATTRLTARLRADEGRIDFSRGDAPSLGDDVRVHRPGDPADEVAPPPAARNGRDLQLDVRADLGPAFQVSGRGLAARLAGELRLTSPANRLQLNGDIRAVDGTYAAYGQKLRIDRGLVGFTGALDNPRLDVRALRDDLDEVRVGVAITGTAQAPRVRLYSDPAMSDTERLSWLMLGRAPDGLGGTDLALLQRAAYALFAGESDSPSVLQRLGIDSLSVSQSDGTVRETVVSLGKQLSRRWYVGYERSLQATAGSWQLIYRIAQRFTLRAQTGSENALDLIWSWRWGR